MKPKVFDAILADVAAGEPTYRAILANHVSPKTFWGAIGSNEEQGSKYARAKLAGLERLADEIVEISDATEGDVILDEESGKRLIDNEAVQRARLRVDTRKWLLSKLAPKKYGDKLGLTDGEGKPLNINVTLPWQDKTQE